MTLSFLLKFLEIKFRRLSFVTMQQWTSPCARFTKNIMLKQIHCTSICNSFKLVTISGRNGFYPKLATTALSLRTLLS